MMFEFLRRFGPGSTARIHES